MGKSLPCKFFQKGTCAYSEDECVFSHSSTQKKKVCPFFLKGTCRYGDACALKHSKKGSGVKGSAPAIPKPKAQVISNSSRVVTSSVPREVVGASSSIREATASSSLSREAASASSSTSIIPLNTTFANLIKKTELIALDDMDQDLDILNYLPSSMDELSPESASSNQEFESLDQDILKPWLIASEHLNSSTSKESKDWSMKVDGKKEESVDEQSLCPFYYQGQCRYFLILLIAIDSVKSADTFTVRNVRTATKTAFFQIIPSTRPNTSRLVSSPNLYSHLIPQM
jgi:hypothetical protein